MHTPLEVRQRSMDSTSAAERVIVLGTDQPVILIEFIGEVGVRLDRIIIDATGYETDALAELFEALARSLRGEAESTETRTD